jgi:hypothetical protein
MYTGLLFLIKSNLSFNIQIYDSCELHFSILLDKKNGQCKNTDHFVLFGS